MKILERRLSFNAGEWSEFTAARTDMEKARSACLRMENFFPAIYGGAFTRAGLLHVAMQPNGSTAARLAGFEYSAATNLVMVFSTNAGGQGEFTVFTNGATPSIPQMDNASVDGLWTTATAYKRGAWVKGTAIGFTAIYYCNQDHTSGAFNTDIGAGKWTASTDFKRATPYAADEIEELQFAQINDVVYISHPNHTPHILSRFANNRWTLLPMVQEWPALRDDNITAIQLQVTAGDHETAGATITIESGAALFQAGHVGSRWVIRHRREDPYVTLLIKGASVGDTSDPLFVLGAWSLSVVTGNDVGQWEVIGVVERSYNGSDWEAVRSIAASRADRSGIITGSEIDPCYLRVKLKSKDNDTDIPDHGKFTLECTDPDHYGIFEVASVVDAQEVQATVVFPLGDNNATKLWAEPAWSDYRGHPRSICIHDSRLFFGGNEAQPQTIWGSVIDDFTNFRLGANDDVGFQRTLAQRANAIQWLVSQEALIVGTAGAEGPLGSRDSESTLTPGNAKAGRFSQTGSAHIQALPVHDAVVFVNRSRRRVWEMAFKFEADGYQAADLTLFAEHIAKVGIRQMALQRAPDTVLWFIDGSGELLGVSYDRSQRVAGWFRYVTGTSYSDAGAMLSKETFESVAVVGGDGEEDQVWVVVNRGGSRRIERLQPERMRLLKTKDQAHLCCADAAVIYDGAPATTIGGLSHLEGRTVTILADGKPMGTQVVDDGEIVLQSAASVVIVGLPFFCFISPTWLETNDPASLSIPAVKGIHRLTLTLWNSSGGSASASNGVEWERFGNLQQGQAMDTAIPLYSGTFDALVGSRSERRVSPIIRQIQPLPLNLLNLHVWYEMNAN